MTVGVLNLHDDYLGWRASGNQFYVVHMETTYTPDETAHLTRADVLAHIRVGTEINISGRALATKVGNEARITSSAFAWGTGGFSDVRHLLVFRGNYASTASTDTIVGHIKTRTEGDPGLSSDAGQPFTIGPHTNGWLGGSQA